MDLEIYQSDSGSFFGENQGDVIGEDIIVCFLWQMYKFMGIRILKQIA